MRVAPACQHSGGGVCVCDAASHPGFDASLSLGASPPRGAPGPAPPRSRSGRGGGRGLRDPGPQRPGLSRPLRQIAADRRGASLESPPVRRLPPDPISPCRVGPSGWGGARCGTALSQAGQWGPLPQAPVRAWVAAACVAQNPSLPGRGDGEAPARPRTGQTGLGGVSLCTSAGHRGHVPAALGGSEEWVLGIPSPWALQSVRCSRVEAVGPRCRESATVRRTSVNLPVRGRAGAREHSARGGSGANSHAACGLRRGTRGPTHLPRGRAGLVCAAAAPHWAPDSLLEIPLLGAGGPGFPGFAPPSLPR